MFQIQHNNKTYRVIFKHFNNKTGPGTLCAIQERLNPEAPPEDKALWYVISVSSTRINPQDQVNRPFGRELSFTRALRKVSQALRGELLQAYYRQTKGYTRPDWMKALLQRERQRWA